MTDKASKIKIIRFTLMEFAEDYKKEMSANVFEGLWNIIQGIDKDNENN